jgi:DNA-binding response OmpR family regulator
VFQASTGARALALFHKHPVALVLLDLMLPDMTGEEVCAAIRAQATTPIIMMTARVDEQSIVSGLKQGADDYVTKPFSPRQLVARVEAVLRRSASTQVHADPSNVLHTGDLVIDLDRRTVARDGKPLELTTSEYRIITLLAANPFKVFARQEIIDRIRVGAPDGAYDGFDRSIDSHVKNIRQKVERDSKAPRYLQTVYGMGYRWAEALR